TVSGGIGDASAVRSLFKGDSGVLLLTSSASYTGGTSINGGTLRIGAGGVLPNSGGVTLGNGAGAVLDLNGHAQTISSLSGGGSLGGNVSLGSATLTVGDATSQATYAGVISGTGGLTKQGSGELVLSTAHSYTGTTNIN